MWVLEASAEPDLAKEAIGSQCLRQFGVEDFEGDGPVVAEVVGEIDSGHSTASQLTLEGVAIAQRVARASRQWSGSSPRWGRLEFAGRARGRPVAYDEE